MYNALEGVGEKYIGYEDLVWDAGRVLQITWSSTNDPLHENSVDKPRNTNNDNERGSNNDTETSTVKGKSVSANEKRHNPFST